MPTTHRATSKSFPASYNGTFTGITLDTSPPTRMIYTIKQNEFTFRHFRPMERLRPWRHPHRMTQKFKTDVVTLPITWRNRRSNRHHGKRLSQSVLLLSESFHFRHTRTEFKDNTLDPTTLGEKPIATLQFRSTAMDRQRRAITTAGVIAWDRVKKTLDQILERSRRKWCSSSPNMPTGKFLSHKKSR